MVHYIYKITCLCGDLSGHYYIGKRTTDYNEKYYGSGRIIRAYNKKYPPVEGVTIIKEILEYNPTKEENARREKEIIGDLYKDDPLCINLKGGGEGGVGYVHDEEWRKKISTANKGRKMSEESRKKMSESGKGRTPWNKGLKYPDEVRKRISEVHKGIFVGENHPMYGKHHSEETRKKISEHVKGKNVGEKHPMYGKHHTEEAKQKIREDHLGKYTGKDNPNHKEITAVVVKTGEVEHYNTLTEAADILNVSISGISQALHGKLKTAYKRIWTFD